jgi:hypothetical protein
MFTNMDGSSALTIDQATLDEIARRILSVASPEKIIPLGSAATGEMNADSDIALLIIEADPGNQRKESVRIHSSRNTKTHASSSKARSATCWRVGTPAARIPLR